MEFLAASMTLDMGNTDKLAEFRAEAERLGMAELEARTGEEREKLLGVGWCGHQ